MVAVAVVFEYAHLANAAPLCYGRLAGVSHDALVIRQGLTELARKMLKAKRRSIWTQEDIDYAKAMARASFWLRLVD
jgi:hypothetical protein